MRRTVLAAVVALATAPALAVLPADAGTPAATSVSASVGYLTSSTTRTVVNGESVTVSGTFKVGGSPTSGVSVDLWAKRWGGTWTRISSDTTDASGKLHLTRVPSKQTYFQWRFPGDASRAASTSNTVTVKVATRVGIRVADSSLSSGQRLVATGGTRPAKPGETAILWSHRPTSRTKLATATVRRDGTYRLTKVLRTRASYSVYVTVSGGGGNLLGTSDHRTVTVR